MANNAVGTVLALGIVGGLAYLYRDKLSAAFGKGQSGDFVNIPGSNALGYVGTPTDSLAPPFGNDDVTALLSAGTNRAPQSASNPFRTVAGTGLTMDQILSLPVL